MVQRYRACEYRNVDAAFERFFAPGADFRMTSTSPGERVKGGFVRAGDWLHRQVLRRRAVQLEAFDARNTVPPAPRRLPRLRETAQLLGFIGRRAAEDLDAVSDEVAQYWYGRSGPLRYIVFPDS